MFVIERSVITPRGKKYTSYIKSNMLNTFALTYNKSEAKRYTSAAEAQREADAYRKHTKFSIPEIVKVAPLV